MRTSTKVHVSCSISGLFHRAILMSGSSFSTWSLVEDPVHYAVKVANSLNCTVPTNMMKNHQDIVKCLREKPLSDIMSVDVKAPSFLTAMGPSRDGVLIPSDFGTSSIHIRYLTQTNNCCRSPILLLNKTLVFSSQMFNF